MEFRCANKGDLSELYRFSHSMYPDRTNYKELIDFWVSKDTDEISNIVLAVDEDNKIKGQQFFSTMKYNWEGERKDGVWAFDLIVDEDLRSESQGFALMWYCRKVHRNTLSTGSNDISLPINLKIGNAYIGNLKKFVGITNPLYLPFAINRGVVKREAFPDSVDVKGMSFRKVDVKDMNLQTDVYNDGLLEIDRSKEFLNWRYSNDIHEYVIYKSASSDDYFVVRTIEKKHISALVLIDYRCSLDSSEMFDCIFKASKKIACSLKLPIMIFGSSLKITDDICRKHGFRSVGRDRPILGMLKVANWKEQIEARNFTLVTLADSDGETTW